MAPDMPAAPSENEEATLQQYFRYIVEDVRDHYSKLVLAAILGLLFLLCTLLVVTTKPLTLVIFIFVLLWALYSSVMSRVGQLGDAFVLQQTVNANIQMLTEEVENNLGLRNNSIHILVVRDTEREVMTIHAPHSHTIIFKSEVLEDLNENDIRILLVREASRIIYKSASLEYLLRSLADRIEVLGLGRKIRSLFGPWLRRIERNANRLAVLYTRDPEAVISTLLKVNMGREANEIAVRDGALMHLNQSGRITRHFVEALRDTPLLVSQVEDILQFATAKQIPVNQQQTNQS